MNDADGNYNVEIVRHFCTTERIKILRVVGVLIILYTVTVRLVAVLNTTTPSCDNFLQSRD